VDPLGLGPDTNWYRDEGDNPTNANDPSGLDEDIPPLGPAPFVVDMWKKEVRRKLLTPAESVEYWKQKAQQKLAAFPPKTVDDVINNNKKISAFYASMFKTDRNAFLWFGMGAYASYGVGQGLAETAWAARNFPGLDVFGNTTPDIFAILGRGNLMIFLDLAWIAIAYREGGGIKELERLKWAIDPDVYLGWVEMDAARKERNQVKKLDLALKATERIIRREQKVLQGVLDSVNDKKMIRQLTPTLQLRKPVFPGGDWNLDDFGILEYRIKRANEILGRFEDYQFKSPDAVLKFMDQRIKEGK
jgi:hypothetical protein